jgi:hypothetical protein
MTLQPEAHAAIHPRVLRLRAYNTVITPHLDPNEQRAGLRMPDCLSALSAAVVHRTALTSP